MSIRLRLTLLYSAILSLTLIIFGVALYSIQAQSTLDALKADLTQSSEKLVEAALRTGPDIPGRDQFEHSPPPQKFDDFSSDQAFDNLREREIARILDADGNLVASPFGREEDALPLSEEGLETLQSQQEWWEEAAVSGEHMLIYNRPIVQQEKTEMIIQVARSLKERDRTLKSLAVTMAAAGLVTILLAFGAGWTLSGLTLQPINRMTRTAQAIGEERDFSRRVDYSGPPDEVGRLAGTFNQMLSSLQEAYQKVELALHMQRDFVADVSHELRTPLTTLRGNLGLLRRGPPEDVQADILTDMVDESDRLIRLVNDLLQLARADAGWSLARESIELAPVLEETIRQARQLDQDRSIVLEKHTDVSILGDRDAFKQVMLILLDNALKHSEGGIWLGIQRLDTSIEVYVRDEGPGIPADQIEHVFERFHRSGDKNETAGFGLGLPIARSLVEGMRGTIYIESEQDSGSTIRMRFLTPASAV